MSGEPAGTVRATRRLKRLQLPDRTNADGVLVTELEDRVKAVAGAHKIDFDLTSVHTGAFPPPPYFLESTARAIREGRPGYTAIRGDLGVRTALAPRLESMLGVPVDPAGNLLLTAGTQAALFATFSVLVEAGDTVLVADPEYMCEERVARFFGADVRRVPFARRGPDASLDLDAVEQGLRDGARVLVFSNPHNPTGSVMSADSLSRLAELVVEADAWVIADELYARFVYDDGPMEHLIALPGMADRCVTCLGPSKTESASGFRVGALVGPPELLKMVARVVEITTIRAPAYAQYALEHWLTDEDQSFVNDYLTRYRHLRELTVERLGQVEGVTVQVPAATAWLFPDVSGLGRAEHEVVEALIKAGVLVMLGSSFGPAGEGCLRMAFGHHEQSWPGALDRIAETLDGLRR